MDYSFELVDTNPAVHLPRSHLSAPNFSCIRSAIKHHQREDGGVGGNTYEYLDKDIALNISGRVDIYKCNSFAGGVETILTF